MRDLWEETSPHPLRPLPLAPASAGRSAVGPSHTAPAYLKIPVALISLSVSRAGENGSSNWMRDLLRISLVFYLIFYSDLFWRIRQHDCRLTALGGTHLVLAASPFLPPLSLFLPLLSLLPHLFIHLTVLLCLTSCLTHCLSILLLPPPSSSRPWPRHGLHH